MDAIREALGLSSDSTVLSDVGLALLAVFAGLLAGRIAHAMLSRLLAQLPDDGLRHAAIDSATPPLVWALRLGGLWIALRLLPLPEIEGIDLSAWLDAAYQATTIGLATWLGVRVVGEATAMWARRASVTDDTFDDQLVPVVRKAAKVALTIVGVMMILQNMGYAVGSLLAGLGIGGAAVAFASKDTIANFFGSLVIFIDRPFQVGDWVEIGDVEGTVEEVDLRTTQIRTFSNSLITVPNSQMTVTAIENWSRMQKRRIKVEIGISYAAKPQQMRDAVEAIREIIRTDDRFHHDFFLVNFHELGESSLNIFCYFFTRTTNWADYMETRQDFLLAVMAAVQELGLEIAFPTRTVHVVGAGLPGEPEAMQRETPR